MHSYSLVAQTIRGQNPGRTPIYGWVRENLKEPISAAFGSVENFEDHYGFDMAHIFGGPYPFPHELGVLKSQGVEITPQVLLDLPLNDPNRMEDYQGIARDLEFYRAQRGRFCYVQTNGFFECHNDPFGIENHLMYMALYPDELREVYARQAKWNKAFIENCLELGVDMIHISDDWGAQKSLLFSPTMFHELIMPFHRDVARFVKDKGAFLSLHSDGCVKDVLDDIADMGYDVLHPYQESAGMQYDAYLEKYADRFAIFGGLCVQTTLGFGNYERLEREIRRVCQAV